MTEVCALVNPDAISEWLAPFANRDPHIHKLLQIALEPVLKNRLENLQPVESLPQNAPEWLCQQWHTATQWYEFAPRKDIKLVGRVHLFANSIERAVAGNAPWLKNKDVRGYPLPLLRIKTIDDAMKLSQDIYEGIEPVEPMCLPLDTELAHEFPDGFKILQLLTTPALDEESKLMKHCLGNGSYDSELLRRQIKVFSLRDPDGIPHATFHVDTTTKEIKQCRGKQNAAPVDKYFPYLRAFFELRHLKIPANECMIGIIQHEGKYYDMFSLPEGLHLQSYLSYYQTTRPVKLPEGLKIDGSLYIEQVCRTVTLPSRLDVGANVSIFGCPHLETLPQNMDIGGTLNLTGNNAVRDIPQGIRVKGQVKITFMSGLQELGNNFMTVNGSLHLYGCTGLRRLPQKLQVRAMTPDDPLYDATESPWGDFMLNNCIALEELPRFLEVDGALHLYGCTNLRRLPENMVVKGNIYTDFGIFKRVESFYKAFEKHRGDKFD